MANMGVEMLRWVFPAEQTDPVLHLAYWHVRLLSELLSSTPKPDNVLQASRNVVGLLASNRELLSPLTHHFVALAALALLHLATSASGDSDETRSAALALARDVLAFSLAPSPWNAAVREGLVEKVPALARPPTTGSGSEPGTSQNLQQLADLATAVENSAPAAEAAAAAPAPAEDGSRDELLAGTGAGAGAVSGDAAAAPVAPPAKPGEDQGGGGGGEGEGESESESAAHSTVDVRALLRAGYLVSFEEPSNDAVSV